MLIMLGAAIVLLGVIGGFVLEGGHALLLVQPVELLIIGGAALGALLIGTPLKVLRAVAEKLPVLLRGGGPTAADYQELLTLLYGLFVKARKDGFMALDPDVASPHTSPLFSPYPRVLRNHHLLTFLCDALKLLVDGAVTTAQLEALLDAELESLDAEEARGPALLTRVADSLPGLGIVAAVLGIVITMQAINGPPEEIGRKVAVALVGTFIGILLCYGFVGPLANNLHALAEDDAQRLQGIKTSLVAFASGCAPSVAIEFARRAIFRYDRPTSAALEAACKEANLR